MCLCVCDININVLTFPLGLSLRTLTQTHTHTQVYPTLALRIKFPDGAILQAHFHEDERVQDVISLVREALSRPLSTHPLPFFSLLSLGGMRGRLAVGEGREGTMTQTLKECGLTGPAATLMLQWVKKRHGGEEEMVGGSFPKVCSGVCMCVDRIFWGERWAV